MTLTRSQARAFERRWRIVNAAERSELRRTTMDARFRQLAALMASASTVGGASAHATEDALVRRRWMAIRRALGDR